MEGGGDELAKASPHTRLCLPAMLCQIICFQTCGESLHGKCSDPQHRGLTTAMYVCTVILGSPCINCETEFEKSEIFFLKKLKRGPGR